MEIDGFYLFVAGEIGIGILLMQSWAWLEKVIRFIGVYIIFPALIIGGIWSMFERDEQRKRWNAANQRVEAKAALEARLKDKSMPPKKTVIIDQDAPETFERLLPIQELIEGGLRGKIL
jgi:hypothetical protein